MSMYHRMIWAGFVAGLATVCMAKNPILPGYADPHMRVWDGRVYLAVGKDHGPDIKAFKITHWDFYSSEDLINWRHESRMGPEHTFIGEGRHRCWAGDLAEKNGKYYFYFSNGGKEMGVAVSDKPGGPYRDALGKPFLSHDFSLNHEYDPTIFTEDNGDKYVIYGRDGYDGKNHIHYQIAKLSDDMLSLEGEPRDLMTDRKYGFGFKNEKKSRARDHQYFHKHNGIYYLSADKAYMTSTNLFGPYGNMRNAYDGMAGHSSFIEYNGQWYLAWEYSCEPYGNRRYRQVMLTYLHYRDNGDLAPDKTFMPAPPRGLHYENGVGSYGADWPVIEAEWFFKRDGQLLKKECPAGGFELQNIHAGDSLCFPNVKDVQANSTIRFKVSSKHKAGGAIEVRAGTPDGDVLGTATVEPTGDWDSYQNVSCTLRNDAGKQDLCFVFKGQGGELMRLDSFVLLGK